MEGIADHLERPCLPDGTVRTKGFASFSWRIRDFGRAGYSSYRWDTTPTDVAYRMPPKGCHQPVQRGMQAAVRDGNRVYVHEGVQRWRRGERKRCYNHTRACFFDHTPW